MKSAVLMPPPAKDKKNFREQLKEAKAFFNDPKLPARAKKLESNEGDPYADKDGLVEFIVATELVEDEKVMERLLAQKKDLIAMTSIVTDYVMRYAEANGEEYKTDEKLWELAVSKLPLMGPSVIEKQSYSRKLSGLEIAKDFIDFIMDLVVSQGTEALSSFNNFLEKQGEAIEFGVSSNKDYYSTISIGVTAEVFQVGNEIIYTPKLKQYQINFDRENSQFTTACGSYQTVTINFDYLYAANVFDYEALENPEVAKDFYAFLESSQKAQIEEADTFFDSVFPPSDVDPPA